MIGTCPYTTHTGAMRRQCHPYNRDEDKVWRLTPLILMQILRATGSVIAQLCMTRGLKASDTEGSQRPTCDSISLFITSSLGKRKTWPPRWVWKTESGTLAFFLQKQFYRIFTEQWEIEDKCENILEWKRSGRQEKATGFPLSRIL